MGLHGSHDRRLAAKIEWYQDELFPRVGFTEGFSLGFRHEGVMRYTDA